MRVGIISKQVRDYSEEFVRALGHHCDVSYYGTPGCENRIDGSSTRVSVQPVQWPRHRSLRNPTLMAALLRRIESDNPDVVHVLHEHNVWLSLLLPFLRRRWPIVVTVHDARRHPGDWDTLLVPSWFRRLSVRLADAVIVHGQKQLGIAQEVFGVSRDRLYVLPHLALPRYRRIAGANGIRKPCDGLVRVLFFGRLYEYKGLDYLIASAPLVGGEGGRVRYTIAGSGKLSGAQRRSVKSLPHVTLINRHIDEDEAARLFCEADIVVLPYVAATQSGVLAIASTFGKPVVVTDVGELPAVVRGCNMGLVVPPRDAPALARAITLLASDEQCRDAFGRAAQVASEGRLSGARIAADAVNIYEHAITRNAQEKDRFLESAPARLRAEP